MKLIDFTAVKNIFIVCGKTDMRRQIDGLATTILQEYDMNVYEDALFLFCGGKKDRFKALYWEGDGFILVYKRLENGRLKWPKDQNEVKELTSQQLRCYLKVYQSIKKLRLNLRLKAILDKNTRRKTD